MKGKYTMAAIAVWMVIVAPPIAAQRPARPVSKGIWEPVSYPADAFLTDVFFVSPDVGWVTGGNSYQGGVLLRTKDGGANWDLQLGDHESKEPAFYAPYFLDETHGWVLQVSGIGRYKLLRTSDGESWQQVGAVEAGWGLLDYVFLSKSVGLYLDGNNNVARIVRTSDGGRTWTDVFHCNAKMVINGLSRDVQCTFKALHFPSANVGYAIGGGNGAGRTLFVAKTEDGGQRWALTVVPDIGGEGEVHHDQELFFTDENTGFATLSENRLVGTTDGGRTWSGLVGTPGTDIKFADPEVGWSFWGSRLIYTTNGGKRWSSRDFSFPARVYAFSFPRRDRGYVVGEHGMVFRYSVVPGTEPTPPNAIEAPPMPPFDSELDDQVETVDQQFETLEGQIEAATASAGDTTSVAACCAQSVTRLQGAVDALTPLVPQFLSKYRNVNLLIAGLQFLGALPDQLAEVKTALTTLRQARGATATAAALTNLSAAIDALAHSTRQAFQKEPMQYAAAGEAGGRDATSSAVVPSEASADAAAIGATDTSASSQAEQEIERKLKDDAAKKIKEEAKKKIKIRFP